jgi:hypothetical protein
MKNRTGRCTLIGVACTLFILFLPFLAIAQEVTIIKNTSVGRYGEAQVELLCQDDIRLLFDVADLESLSRPVTKKDILLTTHTHPDHFIQDFADSFPGIQLRMEEGEIDLPNMRIKSIVASHTAALPTKKSAGDNYIIIVDIPDLRIVHFGDLEQKSLTSEQLSELQKIDIAFMTLSEPPNEIINLLKPHILIPTHLWGSPATKSIIQRWQAYKVDRSYIKVTKDSLPAETTLLFIGDWGERIGNMYKLPAWEYK